MLCQSLNNVFDFQIPLNSLSEGEITRGLFKNRNQIR